MTFRPSPKYCAQICIDSYARETFDFGGGVQVLLVDDGQALYVSPRGTEADFQDIMRDIRGYPWYDEHLGWCHSGFLFGARDRIWASNEFRRIVHGTDRPIVLTGHSLGGALGLILGGYMALSGVPPAAIVTFGAPCAQYGTGLTSVLLRRAGVPVVQYVRGNDCVPDHPFLGLHVVIPTRIGPERTFWGRWGLSNDRFTDHKIAPYWEDAPEEWAYGPTARS